MFTHDIYRNIRVRVIIVRQGKIVLGAPCPDRIGRDAYRGLPGGGLEPNETLYEAGEREVREETGLKVKVTSVAFLREWVVPKHCPVEQMREWFEALGFSKEETHRSDHGYGLEVYLWAEVPSGADTEPMPGDRSGAAAEWVAFEQVAHEPVFPIELKALARDLAEGRAAVGVPVFATGFESPWKEPDWEAFRRVQDSRPHP